MTEIEVTLPPAPPPVVVTVTVIDVLAVNGPLKPLVLAVIVVVPAARVVARPAASIVATAGLLEFQVTPLVIV